MDKNTINCEIVKDLIPLYSEGLCSETGRAAVESHIAECESCRRLLNTPIERERPAPVPPEKNVFKKLSRRLKMNMAVMISLGVVLLGVLGVVGYLSVGQIVKGAGMVSFETISQSIEVKKLARYIADRDFKGYLDAAYCGEEKFAGITRRVGLEGFDFDKLKEHNAAEFAPIYDEVVGDRKVKKISAHSEYFLFADNVCRIYTLCTLEYDDGAYIVLEFFRESENSFEGAIYNTGGFEFEKHSVLEDSFNMLNFLDDMPKHFVEVGIKDYIIDPEHAEDIERRADFLSRFFAEDHREQISAGFVEFFAKGYTVADCDISTEIYDENYDHFSNIWIKAQDGSGTAIFKGKIYSDIKGMKPPCDIEIYRDGCTDELAESLAKMFG